MQEQEQLQEILQAKKYQPYEIRLNRDLGYQQGFEIVQRNNTITQSDLTNQINNLEVLVCVTMYNEPLIEMERSITGVTKSLHNFKNRLDIGSNKIGIVVLFDMMKINQEIIWHTETLDQINGIDQELSLKTQYERLKQYQQFKKKYTKEYLKQKSLTNQLQQCLNELKTESHLITTNVNFDEEDNQFIYEEFKKISDRAEKYINERDDTCYVYEECRFIEVELESWTEGHLPYKRIELPIYYVFRHRTGVKLDSHVWFFNGFCKHIQLQPRYCLLVDGGAEPINDSVYKMYLAMETDLNIGGVCGTMKVRIEPQEEYESDILAWINQLFNIQQCQQFEYFMAHQIDKAFESSLGFIHVLPGAYSMYRWTALSNRNLQRTLDMYFTQVLEDKGTVDDLDQANMFLAEDRVLCQHIFCTQQYTLQYVKDAEVEVDCMPTLESLQLQRKRWINGSWFALNHVLNYHHSNIQRSDHTLWSRMKFQFNLLFASIGQLIVYMFPTFQSVWLFVVFQSLCTTQYKMLNESITKIVLFGYFMMILQIMYLSLTYDSKLDKQDQKYFVNRFKSISSLLGFTVLTSFCYTVYMIVQNIHNYIMFTKDLNDMSGYLIFMIMTGLAFQTVPLLFSPVDLIRNLIQSLIHFIYYQPTYSHLFVIYSFCRIDDLSWGTKGQVDDETNNKPAEYSYRKYRFIRNWFFFNLLFSGLFIYLIVLQGQNVQVYLMFLLALFFLLILFIRFLGATYYHLKFFFYDSYIRDSNSNISKIKDRLKHPA